MLPLPARLSRVFSALLDASTACSLLVSLLPPQLWSQPVHEIYFFLRFFFHPIIVSAVCPTGPHPPLRPAKTTQPGSHRRRGGVDPLLRYMPLIFFYRGWVQHFHASSTVKSMHLMTLAGAPPLFLHCCWCRSAAPAPAPAPAAAANVRRR